MNADQTIYISFFHLLNWMLPIIEISEIKKINTKNKTLHISIPLALWLTKITHDFFNCNLALAVLYGFSYRA
jgi:hypothetical protein